MKPLPRHSEEDYGQAYADLLPSGVPWPRERDSVLMRFSTGLAAIYARLEAIAADLLEREADPRTTTEMLEDWERNAGLPDPCVAEPLTIEDRRKALVARLTAVGRQDRAYFIELAASLGYTVRIQEYAPYMAGVSRAGDTRADPANLPKEYLWHAGPPEFRYVWRVFVTGRRLSWFRATSGQAGIDPHLRIGIATDLECLFRRYKPAHTQLVFDYSEALT